MASAPGSALGASHNCDACPSCAMDFDRLVVDTHRQRWQLGRAPEYVLVAVVGNGVAWPAALHRLNNYGIPASRGRPGIENAVVGFSFPAYGSGQRVGPARGLSSVLHADALLAGSGLAPTQPRIPAHVAHFPGRDHAQSGLDGAVLPRPVPRMVGARRRMGSPPHHLLDGWILRRHLRTARALVAARMGEGGGTGNLGWHYFGRCAGRKKREDCR